MSTERNGQARRPARGRSTEKSSQRGVGDRIGVERTAKVLIGGKFLRSESGRTFPLHDTTGRFWGNVPLCSRKDARDAVTAARSAQPDWERTTAALRGQILFRLAEMIESRSSQFADELARSGMTAAQAQRHVRLAVDRVFWYAGWADKYPQVASAANPVAGPFRSLTTPTACGVVVAVAPVTGALVGLVEVVCAAVVNGNTVVVVAEDRPMSAVTFGEAVCSSDIPGGVVNVLSGRREELLPPLAAHLGVDALDLADLDDREPDLVARCVQAATANLKRVLRTASTDWEAEPSLARMRATTELRTTWHTVGL